MKIRIDKDQANININFSITNNKAMHFINYMASITKNFTIDINLVNKKNGNKTLCQIFCVCLEYSM